MNAFKITTADGNYWITSMNATLDEAKAYFTGHVHITENFETGEESRSPVISVEQI